MELVVADNDDDMMLVVDNGTNCTAIVGFVSLLVAFSYLEFLFLTAQFSFSLLNQPISSTMVTGREYFL